MIRCLKRRLSVRASPDRSARSRQMTSSGHSAIRSALALVAFGIGLSALRQFLRQPVGLGGVEAQHSDHDLGIGRRAEQDQARHTVWTDLQLVAGGKGGRRDGGGVEGERHAWPPDTWITVYTCRAEQDVSGPAFRIPEARHG